jgi:hypothetical protein
MTLPTETDTPPCPNCSASMRLKRVLPTALPTDCTYSYVFGCTNRGTTITRSIRSSLELGSAGLDAEPSG